MPKQIKKFLVILSATWFVLPSVVFGAGEFELVTRVKNITVGDNPAGAVYTMAQSGDELRHLIIVNNQDTVAHDYLLEINLPTYLFYRENSFEKYNAGAWQKSADILDGEKIHLLSGQTVFLRFTTEVYSELPNENLILGVGVEATNEQNQQSESLNKIYIPNFNIEEDIAIEGITEEEKAEIKQIYQEQKQEIEQTFEKNDGDLSTQTDEEALQQILENTDSADVDFLNLYLGAGIALLILVYLTYKYVRKK